MIQSMVPPSGFPCRKENRKIKNVSPEKAVQRKIEHGKGNGERETADKEAKCRRR
jgi:hypothetical protein